MPTVLVIDDNPVIAWSVKQAVPDWQMLSATSGIQGLEILRERRGAVDIVVLDIDMRGMDGYDTCLQIRSMLPSVPILPYTGRTDELMLEKFMREARCAPPLYKNQGANALREQLHATLGMQVPELPQTAMLIYAQHKAAETESRLREQKNLYIGLYASSPVTQLGLYHIAEAANMAMLMEASDDEILSWMLRRGDVSIIVADAADYRHVRKLAQPYQKALLFVAATLIDALDIVADDAAANIITAQEAARPATFAGVLRTVSQGEHYASPEIAAPFRHSNVDLTPQEQALLTLEFQGFTRDEIAGRLSITPDSVSQYRSRLATKLGVRTKDLAQFARSLLRRS